MIRRLTLAAALVLAVGVSSAAQAYSPAVEQWRPAVDAACAIYGCSTDYLLGVMDCESHGDPGAVGPHGELGIYQIQPALWGVMSSSDQIWFAAKHLSAGDIFWVCA